MLGFSDGTKDGGYLRANWSIFQAKENLTRITGIRALLPYSLMDVVARRHVVVVTRTISMRPLVIRLKIRKYRSPFRVKPLAQILESLYRVDTTSNNYFRQGLKMRVFKNKNQLIGGEISLLNSLAEEGHKAYLDLKHHPKFVPYLEKITPLAFFGDTNIGSRPVKTKLREV